MPDTHFTKILSAHNPNPVKYDMILFEKELPKQGTLFYMS